MKKGDTAADASDDAFCNKDNNNNNNVGGDDENKNHDIKDDHLIPKTSKQRSLLVLSCFFVWQLVPADKA